MLIIYDFKIIFLGRHYVVKYAFYLMTEWMATIIKNLNEPSADMYYPQV